MLLIDGRSPEEEEKKQIQELEIYFELRSEYELEKRLTEHCESENTYFVIDEK